MTRRTFYSLALGVAVVLLLILGGRAFRLGFAAMGMFFRLGAGLVLAAVILLGALLLLGRSGREENGK